MNSIAKTCITMVAFGAILVSGTAYAQQKGGVKIGGDAKINATAENSTTQADNASTASTAVGVVRGNTEVKGDVDISATAKNVTTKAGNKSCAETSVGAVGNGPCQ